MRRLKLMADYDCLPLWGTTAEEIGEVDPADLPISATLVADLGRWAEVFDATLDRDDPLRSGFGSPEAAAAFRTEGERLAERLRRELGDGWSIEFVV